MVRTLAQNGAQISFGIAENCKSSLVSGMSIIGNRHKLVLLSLHPCNLVTLVIGSCAHMVFLVSVHFSKASSRFPMLIRESENYGIAHARVISSGESFKLKFAAPLECEH